MIISSLFTYGDKDMLKLGHLLLVEEYLTYLLIKVTHYELKRKRPSLLKTSLW